ncbi:MAG: hypothetical protein ACLU8Q_01835 [Oscillospiraceae bacterium]
MSVYVAKSIILQFQERADRTGRRKIEKSILISKCGEFEKEYLNWCSVYKAYQDNIRKAGSLLNEIEKSDNLYDIAVNACETISIMTGDESFAERQKRKIQERRLK